MQRQLVRLGSLLANGHDDRAVVAFDADTVVRWSEFGARVAALRDQIRATGGSRWLVFSEDALSLAVGLFAVAHAGGVAVLPPNGGRGTLERLSETADGCLIDIDWQPADNRLQHLDLAVPVEVAEDLPLGFSELDRDAPFVEFYTSGSSGDNKGVAKRLRHLDDEVVVLERVFGAAVGDARVVATVAPHHIYGSLFRVLWPLAAGREFATRTLLHGEEVAARLRERTSVLVSSPVQVKMMVETEVLRGTGVGAVFTSGAPLDEQAAVGLAEQVGEAAFEVFGSTETGGVAWRQRPAGGDVPWRPFPNVDVSADAAGTLVVRSPFASVGEPDGGLTRFVMGDRVEFATDGSFRLRGRVDRTVKIGAKRLSLPDMEAELARLPTVEDVALIAVRRGAEQRVCAAVVLAPVGQHFLSELGRGDLGRELAAKLSPFFDRVLLPKTWRFVDSLPRNAQGKLPAAALHALFSTDEDRPLVDPIVEEESLSETSLRLRCVVPDRLAYFEGHFDGAPVVAGVVQVRWVVAAVARLGFVGRAIRSVEALKFKEPLLPGNRFEIFAEVDEARGRVRFRLMRGSVELSSGRLNVGEAPE